MSFFELIDEKFFNPFCCQNREIYMECMDLLIEKSILTTSSSGLPT